MDTNHTIQLRLPHQGLHAVADASRVEFVCGEGSVWLTLDGVEEDFVLEPGERFQTDEHRRALLYALMPSRVEIVARQRRTPRPAGMGRFHLMPSMKAAR